MNAIASPSSFFPPSSFKMISWIPEFTLTRPSFMSPKSLVSTFTQVSSLESDSSWLSETLADLKETILLEQGWDSYDAPPPEALPIRYASSFVEALSRTNLRPKLVSPTVMGGIAISFRNERLEVFLEFYNDGRLYVMFADDNDPDDIPRVEPFSPEDYTSYLIPEIRGFLHA